MSDHRIDAEQLLASIADDIAALPRGEAYPLAIGMIASYANARALLALVDEVRGVKEQLAALMLTANGLAPQVDSDLAEDAVAAVHTVIARTASGARRAKKPRAIHPLTDEAIEGMLAAAVNHAKVYAPFKDDKTAMEAYSDGYENALNAAQRSLGGPGAP